MEVITENKFIPKLRFKEFDDDWILKKIDKIAPLQRGFDLPLRKIQKGNYPVVYSNGILRTHNEYKVKGEGVVTGRSGTIGKVTFVKENHWPHNTTLWVTNYFNNNKKFIYYFYLQLKLQRFNAGSTVPTLNRNDVHFLNKRIPNQIKEQQKMASFLTVVDEKLQQLTKKKELIEDFKKGIMQKIFSQEIRFKDDNGNNYPDWEEKNLGELCELKNGYAFKSATYVSGGYYNIVTIKNVQDGRMVNDFKTLNNIPSNLESHQILHLDDILISMTGNVGRVCKVKFKNCILNQRVGKIIPKNVFKNYLYYILNSKKFLKSMENIGQGAAQMNIGTKDILVFKSIHPNSVQEQQKIANFLSAIDNKIESVSVQIEKTKEFKKGLLQQMFV